MAATKRKTTAKKTVKKPVAKKTTARKTTVKKAAPKTTARKTATTAAKPAAKRISVGEKPFNKSQLLNTLSEQSGVSKKEVGAVIESLGGVIAAHMKKRGPNAFALPGILKMKVVKKPATKARKGTNPFTGEPTVFKAKPASRKVRITALKKLKEMADN